MDPEDKLIKISDELQIEIIKSMEIALIKIADQKVGGTMAQRAVSLSIIYCWILFLKQITPNRRAKLFKIGCENAADQLLEFAKKEALGLDFKIN